MSDSHSSVCITADPIEIHSTQAALALRKCVTAINMAVMQTEMRELLSFVSLCSQPSSWRLNDQHRNSTSLKITRLCLTLGSCAKINERVHHGKSSGWHLAIFRPVGLSLSNPGPENQNITSHPGRQTNSISESKQCKSRLHKTGTFSHLITFYFISSSHH